MSKSPCPEHTNLSTSRLFIVASQVLFSLRINMGNRLSHLITAFIGSRMCSTNSQTNDLVTEFLDMGFLKRLTLATLCLFTLTASAQCPQVLHLTGTIGGSYQADTIFVDQAFANWLVTFNAKEVIITNSAFERQLKIDNEGCDCLDNTTPGIAIQRDTCISDEEWDTEGYLVLTDSAAFYSAEAMEFFNYVGTNAYDDCGIDTFYVEGLTINPPGGVDRPVDGTREFLVAFYAEDYSGKFRRDTMRWVRTDHFYCHNNE